MGVDFLRVCYRRRARWLTADGRTIPIRWYFCAPGAKLFPHPSAFHSNVWEYKEDALAGTGEVDRSLTFDRGNNPGFAGLSFNGQPSWFVDGMPASLLGTTPFPRVCEKRALGGQGGVEIGGSAPGMFSDGMGMHAGVVIGGSSMGAFSTTSTGGIVMNGGALFGGDIDLAGMGGVQINSTAIFGVPIGF